MASINLNFGFKQEPAGKKSFVYKDAHFCFNNFLSDGDNSSLHYVQGFKEIDDEEAIYNGIYNIFRWKKGERIILPEFGNPLYPYLYEPITEVTASNIAADITRAIEQWEPRARLNAVNVIPDADNNQYSVSLELAIPILSNSKIKKLQLKLSTV